MPVVVVGLNHKTAPIDLLGRLTIAEEDLPKALHQLETYEHVLEGVVLSTCNRVEVYALVSKFHGGAQDLRNFLGELRHVAPEDLVDHLYTYHDETAVGHLFRVAAGIDSMIVGESEILGQVRRAYKIAVDEGAAKSVMGTAFRRALRTGKRARAETNIGRNPVSISSAAVDLARRSFGSLDGRKVAIVGAGKMGRLAARSLAQAGATDIVVVNRSEERAREVAELFGARMRPFAELANVLAEADIAITSTTAPQAVITTELVGQALANRAADEPLFIVDIAVPRDVEAEVRAYEGVVVKDIENLRSTVESNRDGRLSEVSRVEAIIGEEVDRFNEWERSSEFKPTAAALVSKADAIREAEFARVVKRADFTPEQRDAIDHMSRRMVAKLLHGPLTKARDAATVKKGYLYTSSLRELFDLDEIESSDESLDD